MSIYPADFLEILGLEYVLFYAIRHTELDNSDKDLRNGFLVSLYLSAVLPRISTRN